MAKNMKLKEWEKVALALRVMRRVLFKSVHSRTFENVPKALLVKTTLKVGKWLDNTKSRLEGRMYEEHGHKLPRSGTVEKQGLGIFYGTRGAKEELVEELAELVEQKICEYIDGRD